MTKGDLVREVARARGRSLAETRRVVNALLGSIERALTEGNDVTLRDFGRFRVEPRARRKTRVPGSARIVEVPARLVPVFRHADDLERRLRGLIGSNAAGHGPPG